MCQVQNNNRNWKLTFKKLEKLEIIVTERRSQLKISFTIVKMTSLTVTGSWRVKGCSDLSTLEMKLTEKVQLRPNYFRQGSEHNENTDELVIVECRSYLVRMRTRIVF